MVAERRLLERLTASDRFMLWEDYGWSSDIGAFAILDGTSLLDRDGRIRIEAVRRRLELMVLHDRVSRGGFKSDLRSPRHRLQRTDPAWWRA